MSVVVVAALKVREGRLDEALAAYGSLVEQTHAEAGCLAYALHRDDEDPLALVLIERWTSSVALENHFQQPYIARIRELAADILSEPPVVRVLTPEPLGDPVKGVL